MSFPAVSPSISNSAVTGIIKSVMVPDKWRFVVVKKGMLIASFINEQDAWDFYNAADCLACGYSVVKVEADATYQEPA